MDLLTEDTEHCTNVPARVAGFPDFKCPNESLTSLVVGGGGGGGGQHYYLAQGNLCSDTLIPEVLSESEEIPRDVFVVGNSRIHT